MTEKEFEDTIQEVANVIHGMHNRLVRIEEWMLTLEKEGGNEESKAAD